MKGQLTNGSDVGKAENYLRIIDFEDERYPISRNINTPDVEGNNMGIKFAASRLEQSIHVAYGEDFKEVMIELVDNLGGAT